MDPVCITNGYRPWWNRIVNREFKREANLCKVLSRDSSRVQPKIWGILVLRTPTCPNRRICTRVLSRSLRTNPIWNIIWWTSNPLCQTTRTCSPLYSRCPVVRSVTINSNEGTSRPGRQGWLIKPNRAKIRHTRVEIPKSALNREEWTRTHICLRRAWL